MPSSIREQILARLNVALTAASPGGAQVFRSREVSITRAISPALVIMPQDNPINRQATMADKNQLEVALEIFVRGDPWDSLADAVDVPMHAIVMNDAQLLALVASVRRIGESFNGQEADRTAGTLTVRYLFTFLTNAADITRAA